MTDAKRSSKINPLDNSQISDYVQQYASRRPLQEQFTGKFVTLLKALIQVKDIEVHLIESRTKDIVSFQEKICRASKRYLDPVNEVTDLSGVRIIVYYEEDLNAIAELIAKEFDIDWDNSVDNRKLMKPEEFGYQSIHYIAGLSESRHTLLEWRHLSSLRAEIQVRTVLQHAWAAISHKLQYKREEDVPQILRRKLFRLSALLELADEEFMGLRDKTVLLTQKIEEQIAEGNTNIEINILTLQEFLNTSSEAMQLVTHAQESGFTVENLPGTEEEKKYLSELVAFCNFGGLKTISDLKTALSGSLKWSKEYLSKHFQVDNVKWSVSTSFLCELILMKVFKDKVDLQFLLNAGWSKKMGEQVLSVAKD